MEDFKVLFLDHVVFEHGLAEPVDKAFPIPLSDKDDGEVHHFVGLDEGNGLREFVERAKTTRHGDITLGITHEDSLADKEIVKIDGLVGVDVRVEMLLERQGDVQPNAGGTTFVGTFVAGLHDARAATRDNAEPEISELLGDLSGHLIVWVSWFGSG